MSLHSCYVAEPAPGEFRYLLFLLFIVVILKHQILLLFIVVISYGLRFYYSLLFLLYGQQSSPCAIDDLSM